MRYIKLAIKQLTRNITIIIAIILELTIVICAFNVCFGRYEFYNLNQQYYDKINSNNNFYWLQGSALKSKNEELKKQIDNFSNNGECIKINYGYDGGFKYSLNRYFYSKEALEFFKYDLDEGNQIDTEKNYGDAIPCLVSSLYSKSLKAGKTYDIYSGSPAGTFIHDITKDKSALLTNGDYNFLGRFYICGVIKMDLTYPFGFFENECMIVYDKDNKAFRSEDYEESTFVKINNVDEFKDKHTDFFNAYLRPCIENLDETNSYFITKTLPFIMLCISFLLLAIIGIITYSVVSISSLQYDYGVFTICGIKKRYILFMTLFKCLLITIIPAIISIPVIREFKSGSLNYVYQVEFMVSIKGYLLSIGFSLGLLIISSIFSVIKVLKFNPIKIIQAWR